MACACSNILKSCVRKFTTSRGASHYDVLGIAPNATHSDIKSAYYKLSMVHHPDKSSDTEAANFRAITEAYEVLSNVRLKRLYDRGLLGNLNVRGEPKGYQPEEEPTDPTLKFYKSRAKRHVAPVDGRTPIYDYDAWSKNHYGEVFNKAKHEKEILRRKAERVKLGNNIHTQEVLMYSMIVMVIMMLMLAFNGKTDYDCVKTAQDLNELKLRTKNEST